MDFDLAKLTEDQRNRLLAYRIANPPRLVSVGVSDRLLGSRLDGYLWALRTGHKQ